MFALAPLAKFNRRRALTHFYPSISFSTSICLHLHTFNNAISPQICSGRLLFRTHLRISDLSACNLRTATEEMWGEENTEYYYIRWSRLTPTVTKP